MTDQIKNRVVGTIVLFTIAIIFLPNILDGKKQQLRDDFSTIPVKPTYQAPDLSKIQPEIIIPPVNIVSEQSTPSTVVVKTEKKSVAEVSKPKSKPTVNLKTTSAPTIKTSPIIKAKPSVVAKNSWVITVGSFKEPKNVKALLLKLRQHKFTAFSVPSRPRAGQTSKVFVGPSFSKQYLIKTQAKLKKIINESGYISAYRPSQK